MGSTLSKSDIPTQIIKLVSGLVLGYINGNKQKKQEKQKDPQTIVKQIIIQKADPKALEQIENLKKMLKQSQQNLQQARKQAQKASSPKMFKQKKQQIFVAFLQNLKQYKFTDNLPKNGKKYHIVIGPISVGKSCLLNKFLNLKLKTGVGETTDKATVVAESQNYQILDSPGANDDFNFYDINTLALFYCVHRVFLLYRTSLKDVKDILRIMKIIKPDQTYLVRTQCDNFSQTDFKTLDEQLKTDKQYAKQAIGHDFPIFATSAKKGPDFGDNETVAMLIKGEQN